MRADAVATALSVLPPAHAPGLLAKTGARAFYVAADSSRQWLPGT
jgi:thiamine biosynthesis lipoprotein ApbE